MSRRVPHRSVLLVLVPLLVAFAPASPAQAAPAVLPDPGGATVDWVLDELATDGGYLTTSFDDGSGGAITVPDYGLTIDAVLALAADGQGATTAAAAATAYVEDHIASYITGTDFGSPDDRYAGPIAKAALVAQVQGLDPSAFGGWDLEATLRGLLQTSGADAGRFSDVSDFGDYSNGFGQALGIMALDRTSTGAPAAAVDFLLDQQCPGGGFRGNYSEPGGCTDDAAVTVDATGMALMALTQLAPTCTTQQAVTDAVGALLAGQNDAGAFGGESGSNANSTGLAAAALRSLDQTDAADEAAAFLASLQLESGADLGALSLNATGFASAADGVQILERDSFRRASTQGVLAFDLPSYAELGLAPVDAASFAPCAEPPVVVDPFAPVPEAVTEPETLPVTGGANGPLSALAVGLIALGAALRAASRRRALSSAPATR